MRFTKAMNCMSLLVSTTLFCILVEHAASAQSTAPVLTTLVAFGSNGNLSIAGLTFDFAGRLYGTTLFGGTGGGQFGSGTVFELSGPQLTTFTSLFSFNGGKGMAPAAGLTLDASGNLYGTTEAGGAAGTGTAFELFGPNHRSLNRLVSFSGSNGSAPVGGLTFFSHGQFHIPGHLYFAGHLFGTTSTGGANGDGTIFELTGHEHKDLTTLVSFTAGVNGARPGSTLVADDAGNLFGTTFTGGPGGAYGTVFELSGPGHKTLTTLVAFTGPNGANPIGGLTLDAAGNLYGTTQYGGPGTGGTIFELAGPKHCNFTTIASFGLNDPNGAVPQGTLLIDAAGNLYGTTNGGADGFGGGGAFLGAIFKLSADHTKLTPLYAFTGNADGDIPQAGLTADAAGNLYGTTTSGGNGEGTVFKLTGSGYVTSLGAIQVKH